MSMMISFVLYTVIVLNFICEYHCGPVSDKELIAKVKEIIKDKCGNNHDLCHPSDVEKIMKEEWIINFALRENTKNATMTALKITNSFNFIQMEKLHDLSLEYFPSEFYATGILYDPSTTKDIAKYKAVISRCFIVPSDISKEMNDLFKRFIMYLVFREVWLNITPNSETLILSLDGITVKNIPISFVFDLLKVYILFRPTTINKNEYFITGFNYITKIPFQMIKTHLKNVLDSNVKLTSTDKLNEYGIDLKGLPKYMGGNLVGYKRIPNGVKSGKCLAHLTHIPKLQWDDYMVKNNKCIIEGMIDANSTNPEQYLGIC